MTYIQITRNADGEYVREEKVSPRMKTVTVAIPEFYTHFVEVEVGNDTSVEAIKDKAKKLFDDPNSPESRLEYVESVGRSLWHVIDKPNSEITCTCMNDCGGTEANPFYCECRSISCDEDVCNLSYHMRGCLDGECDCECVY